VLGQATGTSDQKTHDGLDSGEATTFPHIVFSATLREAILAMPKDKAPGCDGISMEFFQEFISEVSPTLLQAFLAMLRNGETSELFNKGLIILIPKSGDHARIGNWRPITLLRSLYKILAKTQAR